MAVFRIEKTRDYTVKLWDTKRSSLTFWILRMEPAFGRRDGPAPDLPEERNGPASASHPSLCIRRK